MHGFRPDTKKHSKVGINKIQNLEEQIKRMKEEDQINWVECGQNANYQNPRLRGASEGREQEGEDQFQPRGSETSEEVTSKLGFERQVRLQQMDPEL